MISGLGQVLELLLLQHPRLGQNPFYLLVHPLKVLWVPRHSQVVSRVAVERDHRRGSSPLGSPHVFQDPLRRWLRASVRQLHSPVSTPLALTCQQETPQPHSSPAPNSASSSSSKPGAPQPPLAAKRCQAASLRDNHQRSVRSLPGVASLLLVRAGSVPSPVASVSLSPPVLLRPRASPLTSSLPPNLPPSVSSSSSDQAPRDAGLVPSPSVDGSAPSVRPTAASQALPLLSQIPGAGAEPPAPPSPAAAPSPPAPPDPFAFPPPPPLPDRSPWFLTALSARRKMCARRMPHSDRACVGPQHPDSQCAP
eukprot:1612040-Rhodomonas_salina.3